MNEKLKKRTGRHGDWLSSGSSSLMVLRKSNRYTLSLQVFVVGSWHKSGGERQREDSGGRESLLWDGEKTFYHPGRSGTQELRPQHDWGSVAGRSSCSGEEQSKYCTGCSHRVRGNPFQGFWPPRIILFSHFVQMNSWTVAELIQPPSTDQTFVPGFTKLFKFNWLKIAFKFKTLTRPFCDLNHSLCLGCLFCSNLSITLPPPCLAVNMT